MAEVSTFSEVGGAGEEQPVFKLARMSDRSDEALISELKRVAALDPTSKLTKDYFRQHSRVSPTTIRRRFGTWEAALEQAGLVHRYGGSVVTSRMRQQSARHLSDEELLEIVRDAASRLPDGVALTKRRFDELNLPIGSSALHYRFGSWNKAVRRAGVSLSRHATRYTDSECFEALASVWMTLGRAPKYREMSPPLSPVSGKAYLARWGTWMRALEAFIEYAEGPQEARRDSPDEVDFVPRGATELPAGRSKGAGVGDVPARIRWRVGQRDRWRCVKCGRSPATDPVVALHVDHITPRAHGGGNAMENLQLLCAECNLGKGSSLE